MPEPTVQVPVSLIERAHAMIDTRRLDASEVLDALTALVSQPTPTAPVFCEQCGAGAESIEHYDRCVVNVAPPSIADMAPGTTPCADPNVNRWYCQRRADGTCPLPKCVDPSTIRDVTPPKEATT